MKLKFKNQDFQTDAVFAATDLFLGQEKYGSTFSITRDFQLSYKQNDYGVGNALLIDEKTMLANMQAVQRRNNLPLTTDLEDRRFCVEMETGTGKTYVYTKTIYELHKRYGFMKFIVVVPSVAIREGVYKSLEITREHFGLAYDNTPCRFFIYNSSKLSDVRQFATGANIEIMIINIDAFNNKLKNVIYQAQDKLNGESAMRYIQDTNPIVIIDEPQSVDNTPLAKEAIASLNPLCVLRYSATHREKINLLYRLTPVDAYQMGLVKQISVSSNQALGDYNKPYVRLLSVTSNNGFRAKVEIDAKGKDSRVTRRTVSLTPSDGDLFIKSGERELYENYILAGIDCTPGFESIEFTNGETLELGKSMGGIDENILKRAQIRRTVEAHLDKERLYLRHGIKVLSLFFIDEVKKYRQEDGSHGIYAQMFEECYAELMLCPKYDDIRGRFTSAASVVHNGYFSQDKKGKYKDTRGDTLDDYDTYSTIMRDKEWLLSFDCPLRFIFSHSALKEGWDNPNVFQVCTLIEQKSTFTCRQKVGRGLRLCVNQDGERIEDRNINVLHVMANESFAEFAENLQKEIEQETGVKFGILEIGTFSGLTYTEEIKTEMRVSRSDAEELVAYFEDNGFISPEGKAEPDIQNAPEQASTDLPPRLLNAAIAAAKAIADKPTAPVNADTVAAVTYIETVPTEKVITYEDAKELMTHFEDKGYVSKTGKIKDAMRNVVHSGALELPPKHEAARGLIESIIIRADKAVPIRNASRDVTVRLKNEAILSPEFLELWDKIKHRTAYRVQVDSEDIVRRCVRRLKDMPSVTKPRVLSQTADIHINRKGVTHTEREERTTDVGDQMLSLPDVLLVLQDECGIPLPLCRDILIGSGRLSDFIRNPQMFIENCVPIIKYAIYESEIYGIRYMRLDGEEYYLQEVFDSAELIANLDKNAVAVKHSVYDHIIYDSSTVEKPFAVSLDNDPQVKMFFKIPRKFKVETPIGTYNPDWAVYLEKDGAKKLYFVLETKGSDNLLDLRGGEEWKIRCGKAHFAALDDGVELHMTKNWREFKIRN